MPLLADVWGLKVEKKAFLRPGKHYIFFPKDECSWCSLFAPGFLIYFIELILDGNSDSSQVFSMGITGSKGPLGNEETLVLLLRLWRGLLLGGSNI